ncbi:MAG: nuclear transport factor 2 family protein [Thermoanaerobaculia bacterium]|nr:nuclear transport factor 2 family protein [Thermoanaerobaculia bacterium]
MQTLEIAKGLVALCREGKNREALDEYYADDIVSIEGASSPELPARMEGIEAVRGKTEWWYDNHEVHEVGVDGPFVAEGSDQFAAIFHIDVTTKATGERMKMSEVALYTVRDGKIAQEEFFFPPFG